MTRISAVLRKPGLRTAYKRGASFEHVVKRDLEQRGGVVFRSAGSHSPVDLVWCAAQFDRPRAVQAKSEASALSKPKRAEYYQWCAGHGMLPLLATKVRGGFLLQRVLVDGQVVTLDT